MSHESVGREPEWARQYRGLSYEAASREGARLIAEAHESGEWWPIIGRLDALRDQMHHAHALELAGRWLAAKGAS